MQQLSIACNSQAKDFEFLCHRIIFYGEIFCNFWEGALEREICFTMGKNRKLKSPLGGGVNPLCRSDGLPSSQLEKNFAPLADYPGVKRGHLYGQL